MPGAQAGKLPCAIQPKACTRQLPMQLLYPFSCNISMCHIGTMMGKTSFSPTVKNKHNRILCSNLPPPRPSLTPPAEHMWRLLQPHTFPHGTLLAHTHPHQLASPHCPSCGALDTLFPSLCECPRDPFSPFCYPSHWERVLGSYDLAAQETITARAQDVMRAR